MPKRLLVVLCCLLLCLTGCGAKERTPEDFSTLENVVIVVVNECDIEVLGFQLEFFARDLAPLHGRVGTFADGKPFERGDYVCFTLVDHEMPYGNDLYFEVSVMTTGSTLFVAQRMLPLSVEFGKIYYFEVTGTGKDDIQFRLVEPPQE